MSADIVCLEQTSLLLNHIDCLRVILNKQPVTDILAIAVDRKLLTLQCIVDNQRNQLLRELVRSIIVTAVRDICRELISVHICLYKHIRACLTCRIWAVWFIW